MSDNPPMEVTFKTVGNREIDAMIGCLVVLQATGCYGNGDGRDEQALRVLNYLVDRVSAELREPKP